VVTDGVTYEVTVELEKHHRERFDEWFPNVVLDWTTQPDVRSFRVQRGVDDDGHRLRFQFTFESETDWERFTQRGAHRERMARLESIAASVRTALWAPAAVSLGGEGDAIVRVEESIEDGPPDDARQSLVELEP
jgi:heme-degrading monooxygenase HmoA